MAYRSDETGLVAMMSFVAGVFVGVGVALLFAPQEGETTRRQIRDFAEDVGSRAGDYANRVKDRLATEDDE